MRWIVSRILLLNPGFFKPVVKRSWNHQTEIPYSTLQNPFLFRQWFSCYPPGNESISHHGKGQIIDSKVPFTLGDMWSFPGPGINLAYQLVLSMQWIYYWQTWSTRRIRNVSAFTAIWLFITWSFLVDDDSCSDTSPFELLMKCNVVLNWNLGTQNIICFSFFGTQDSMYENF